MDFGLSEDQLLLKDDDQALPRRAVPDDARARRSWRATAATTSGLWKGLAELGVTGLIVPAAYGGSGARAARPRAGRRGARLRRDARAVPRLGHGDGRADRRRRRRAARALAAAHRRRRAPSSPSPWAKTKAEWDPARYTTRAGERQAHRQQAVRAVRAQLADAIIVAAQRRRGPGPVAGRARRAGHARSPRSRSST